MQRPRNQQQHRPSAHRPRRRPHLGELGVTMAGAGAAGLAVGLALVGVDRAWLTPPPIEIGAIASLRSLMTGLVGGLITVAVFSLWMRTVVVGLLSDQFSPRVLVTFLDDSFQRRLLSSIAGGLVAVAVVLMGLPEARSTPAPLASTVASVLIALAALAAVFAAIQHAIASLSPRELVSRLADNALTILDRQPRREPAAREPPPGPDAFPVWGRGTGWVTQLDADALLAALPEDTAIHLEVRVGDFVTPRTPVARVVPGENGRAVDPEAVGAAIRLSRTRDPDRDLAFAIDHLTDVAVHALTGGSVDTATAHEAIVHLGAVLEQVIGRGLVRDDRADDEGRRLFDDAAWSPADHVEMAAKRLRMPASVEPDSSLQLVEMLGKARAAADDAGDRAAVAEIGRQIDAVLTLAERQEMPPHDLQSLARAAETALRGEPHR